MNVDETVVGRGGNERTIPGVVISFSATVTTFEFKRCRRTDLFTLHDQPSSRAPYFSHVYTENSERKQAVLVSAFRTAVVSWLQPERPSNTARIRLSPLPFATRTRWSAIYAV